MKELKPIAFKEERTELDKSKIIEEQNKNSSEEMKVSDEQEKQEENLYQSFMRMKIRMKRKKEREDRINQAQQSISDWFGQEMVIQKIPSFNSLIDVCFVKDLKLSSEEVEENEENEISASQYLVNADGTKPLNYALRAIYSSLKAIQQISQCYQNNSKYSPKTWKFKLSGFKKETLMKTPVRPTQKDVIAFPERLYGKQESLIQSTQFFQDNSLNDSRKSISVKKRKAYENFEEDSAVIFQQYGALKSNFKVVFLSQLLL